MCLRKSRYLKFRRARPQCVVLHTLVLMHSCYRDKKTSGWESRYKISVYRTDRIFCTRSWKNTGCRRLIWIFFLQWLDKFGKTKARKTALWWRDLVKGEVTFMKPLHKEFCAATDQGSKRCFCPSIALESDECMLDKFGLAMDCLVIRPEKIANKRYNRLRKEGKKRPLA